MSEDKKAEDYADYFMRTELASKLMQGYVKLSDKEIFDKIEKSKDE